YRLQAIFASTEFQKTPLAFQPYENPAGFDEGMARIKEMIRRTKEKIEAENEQIRQAVLKRHGVKTLAELPEGALAEALRKKEDLSKEEQARNAAYSKRLEIYNRAVERYQ